MTRKFYWFHRRVYCNDFHSSFNATLINGKGRYPGSPSDVPLAVVGVKLGKRSVLLLSIVFSQF
jgi:hypothetical protein